MDNPERVIVTPEIPFPRGVRDLLPNEALFRNELLNKIEGVFQLFGFLVIDTPSFESIDVLRAKGGIGSDTKLIYELKDEKLGLRYDNTVSLARYINMHQELPMPFKRYYIGKVWRREEPQRLRYREITQADADIMGGNSSMADSEVIAVAAVIIEGLGMEYMVCLNDRQLMDSVLLKFGIDKKLLPDVMRALDKLDKAGETWVVQQLRGLGLDGAVTDQIIAFITMKGTSEEKLDYADKLLGNTDTTKGLRTTLDLIKNYNLRGDVTVSFTIVRGLDYYTGIVFEYKGKSDKATAIGGGGRYDSLIGTFGSKQIPAVGVSLGIDRILEMLDFSSSIEYTYANVFVACVNEKNYPYALRVANALRANGIPTDVNIAPRNLSNQFSYAAAIKTKYVAIIGDVEEKDGKLKLRNLISGNETTVFIDEAIKTIKGE